MTPPDRLRAFLKEPGLVVMPAVWDGLTAKLSAKAGFKTAFLSGSCVAASRLGGPDLDLVSFGEMFDSFNMVHNAAPDTLVLADGDHGYGNAMNVQRTVRAYGRAGAAAILIEDKITPRALTAAGKPCLPDFAVAAIREALPAFARDIPGFTMDDAVMTGVETRTSSPLRIERDASGQSLNTPGLFPAGEGAGYAGGILSAGVDGIRIAEAVGCAINGEALPASHRMRGGGGDGIYG